MHSLNCHELVLKTNYLSLICESNLLLLIRSEKQESISLL